MSFENLPPVKFKKKDGQLGRCCPICMVWGSKEWGTLIIRSSKDGREVCKFEICSECVDKVSKLEGAIFED